jgi:hypothetical protein
VKKSLPRLSHWLVCYFCSNTRTAIYVLKSVWASFKGLFTRNTIFMSHRVAQQCLTKLGSILIGRCRTTRCHTKIVFCVNRSKLYRPEQGTKTQMFQHDSPLHTNIILKLKVNWKSFNYYMNNAALQTIQPIDWLMLLNLFVKAYIIQAQVNLSEISRYWVRTARPIRFNIQRFLRSSPHFKDESAFFSEAYSILVNFTLSRTTFIAHAALRQFPKMIF